MDKLQTIEWASEIIGIPKTSCYAMARQGILPVVKVGRQYRVDPEALREWVRKGGQSYPGGWRKEAALN